VGRHTAEFSLLWLEGADWHTKLLSDDSDRLRQIGIVWSENGNQTSSISDAWVLEHDAGTRTHVLCPLDLCPFRALTEMLESFSATVLANTKQIKREILGETVAA
jgi:hypothetical protein